MFALNINQHELPIDNDQAFDDMQDHVNVLLMYYTHVAVSKNIGQIIRLFG